jgi:ABC-type uncharacterized transport system substrate-binding protein
MPGMNGLSLRQHRSEASFSSIDLGTAKDIETGFQAASKGHADAALVLTNVFAIAQPNHIAELAVKSRIPVIFPQSEYVAAGGLMTYGVSMSDLCRRAASYVDKILQGCKTRRSPGRTTYKVRLGD